MEHGTEAKKSDVLGAAAIRATGGVKPDMCAVCHGPIGIFAHPIARAISICEHCGGADWPIRDTKATPGLLRRLR